MKHLLPILLLLTACESEKESEAKRIFIDKCQSKFDYEFCEGMYEKEIPFPFPEEKKSK